MTDTQPLATEGPLQEKDYTTQLLQQDEDQSNLALRTDANLAAANERENIQPFQSEIIVSEQDRLGLVNTAEYFGGQLQVGCYLLLNNEGQAIVNVERPIDKYDRRGVRTYATGVMVAKINGQYVALTPKELRLLNHCYGFVPQLRGRNPEIMEFMAGLSRPPEAVASALKESPQKTEMKMLPVTLQA